MQFEKLISEMDWMIKSIVPSEMQGAVRVEQLHIAGFMILHHVLNMHSDVRYVSSWKLDVVVSSGF